MSKMSIDLLIGIFTDCAGVKYNCIGILGIDHFISHFFHDGRNRLCLNGVHLASFVLDVEGGTFRTAFGKKLFTFFNVLKLDLCFFVLAQINSSNN